MRESRPEDCRRAVLPSALLLAGVWILSLASCISGPATPEARVRALIERAQEAVVDRDLGILTELISTHYADEADRDRRAIVGLLRDRFLESQAIYLLTRIQRLALPEPARAEATLLVAVGGAPIDSEADISALRADLYQFDLVLADEGAEGWKVIRAAWRRKQTGGLL
jgi:hypothetical protein